MQSSKLEMRVSQTQSPTSGGVVMLKTEDGWYQVQAPLALVDLVVGVFRGFLRNSLKYGVGYLRKILTEGISPIVPSPTSG